MLCALSSKVNVFVHLGSWVAGWWWSWLMSMLLQNKLLKKDEKLNLKRTSSNVKLYFCWFLYSWFSNFIVVTHSEAKKSLSHFFLALGKVLKIWESLCDTHYTFYWWIIIIKEHFSFLRNYPYRCNANWKTFRKQQ